MNRDFTVSKYKSLCESIINSGYKIITVEEYILGKRNPPFVILRHDVDRKPEMALDMARIEFEMGIRATYYFRIKKGVFMPDIIKEINKMGHKIGYHYEVLDKVKGNKKFAIKLFEHELEGLRKITDITTACMHGNPLAKWSNRDLWEEYDFRDYGIIGEPYISIDFTEVFYLSDTGRTWNNKYRVKDIVIDSFAETIDSTMNLIDLIEKIEYTKICILVHPNRWSDSLYIWLWELVWQSIKNVGKKGIIYYRQKMV